MKVIMSETSNGDISGTGRPIDFALDSIF